MLGGRVLFFLILVVIFVIASFFIIKLVNKPAKEFVVEKDTVSFEETADGVFIREFTSPAEVKRILWYSDGPIRKCCSGKMTKSHNGKLYPTNQAYGFKWKFKKDYQQN